MIVLHQMLNEKVKSEASHEEAWKGLQTVWPFPWGCRCWDWGMAHMRQTGLWKFEMILPSSVLGQGHQAVIAV